MAEEFLVSGLLFPPSFILHLNLLDNKGENGNDNILLLLDDNCLSLLWISGLTSSCLYDFEVEKKTTHNMSSQKRKMVNEYLKCIIFDFLRVY